MPGQEVNMHMYIAAYLVVVLVRVEPCCHCSGCIFFLKWATMLSSNYQHGQVLMLAIRAFRAHRPLRTCQMSQLVTAWLHCLCLLAWLWLQSLSSECPCACSKGCLRIRAQIGQTGVWMGDLSCMGTLMCVRQIVGDQQYLCLSAVTCISCKTL